MKILYVDPVAYSATSNKYKYYNGIPNGLRRNCDLQIYNKTFNDLNDVKRETNFNPDFIIFGFGWLGSSFFFDIKNIDVPSAVILFKPQNNLDEKLDFCKRIKTDLILSTIPSCHEYQDRTGIKTEMITYGVDPDVFYDRKKNRFFDIGFSGALHKNFLYPKGSFKSNDIRVAIGEKIKEMSSKFETFWNSSDNPSTAYIDSQKEYAETLSNSKIWIATPAAYEDITPRYFEILSSNCLLMAPTIPDNYRHILIPDKNCIEFKYDLTDFENKVDMILSNEKFRVQLSSHFNTYQRDKFTWNNIALGIMTRLKNLQL
jgi:glycosyltransferase involved in cell wall biosynthesis